MKIIKTNTYDQIELMEEQYKQISSESIIKSALMQDNCLGFYAYEEQDIIGFALLREFSKNQFFLWDFIIGYKYQGCGKGKQFLKSLVDILRSDYSAQIITTTYIYGNDVAKNLYESFGFKETDVVNENGIHEINMKLIV